MELLHHGLYSAMIESPQHPIRNKHPAEQRSRFLHVSNSLLSETIRRCQTDRVPRMGAALSFYTVFSLAPLSILMLSLVSLVIERTEARTGMIAQFRALVGSEGADVLNSILTTTAAANTNTWMTIIGFIVLLIGTSLMFGELRDSLNQIWQTSTERHPLFILIKGRLISYAMAFVLSYLMFLSFLLSATIALAGSYLHGFGPGFEDARELGHSFVSLLIIACLFAPIFRVVPDTRISWSDVWLGAIISAVLFVLGKYLLVFYFGRSANAVSYGAFGSIILPLVWVFYTAQIMLFRAEFTHVYALRHGSHRSLIFVDAAPLKSSISIHDRA